VREVRVSGRDALVLATELLQRARLADPEAGIWEAADLQWWWRKPRASDAVDQLFWVDDDGPVAAVVLTDWGGRWGCDPLLVPGTGSLSIAEVWPRAVADADRLALRDVRVLARDDDHALLELIAGSGFAPTDEGSGGTWLDADDRPAPAPLPDGFTIADRESGPPRPHPMRRRNGDEVEARLRECSLYDAGLDLAVETEDGEVAGYALFWFDPVTKVGLVEPMRVEDAYQRRGLARALLADGVDRLARRGARRLKVGFATEAARALYTGAGFRVTETLTEYRRAS
jgi:ribosomal protein S18 acetylase RimI-like enzyme